jgi:hypothetical protein
MQALIKKTEADATYSALKCIKRHTQHTDTQHTDTQHNDRSLSCCVSFMLRVTMMSVTYAECHLC